MKVLRWQEGRILWEEIMGDPKDPKKPVETPEKPEDEDEEEEAKMAKSLVLSRNRGGTDGRADRHRAGESEGLRAIPGPRHHRRADPPGRRPGEGRRPGLRGDQLRLGPVIEEGEDAALPGGDADQFAGGGGAPEIVFVEMGDVIAQVKEAAVAGTQPGQTPEGKPA